MCLHYLVKLIAPVSSPYFSCVNDVIWFCSTLINIFARSWHRLLVFIRVSFCDPNFFTRVQTLLKEYHNLGEHSRKECCQKWIPRAVLTETECTNICRISAHVSVPQASARLQNFHSWHDGLEPQEDQFLVISYR